MFGKAARHCKAQVKPTPGEAARHYKTKIKSTNTLCHFKTLYMIQIHSFIIQPKTSNKAIAKAKVPAL